MKLMWGLIRAAAKKRLPGWYDLALGLLSVILLSLSEIDMLL